MKNWTLYRAQTLYLLAATALAAPLLSAQQGRTGGSYTVSVGEVRLANLRGDPGSGPDIFVKVRRRNPEIEERLGRLRKELSVVSAESSSASAELSRLKEKDAASRIVPGKPLSSAQLARLKELQDELGDSCRGTPPASSYEKCSELARLVKKKAQSELVPGPPLTTTESERLTSLTAKVANLNRERRQKEGEIKRLSDLLTGSTYRMRDVTHRNLHFSNMPLVTVNPGDTLVIEVWDNDVFESDLRGNAYVALTRGVLADGELHVRMGSHVDYVKLGFRPVALPD